MLAKGFLHWVQLALSSDTFDGGHVRAFAGHRESCARLDGPAVHMNKAGAALARVATDMRARQAKVFAQEIDEQEARLDFRCLWLSVHG
jgi:hypothetical protein